MSDNGTTTTTTITTSSKSSTVGPPSVGWSSFPLPDLLFWLTASVAGESRGGGGPLTNECVERWRYAHHPVLHPIITRMHARTRNRLSDCANVEISLCGAAHQRNIFSVCAADVLLGFAQDRALADASQRHGVARRPPWRLESVALPAVVVVRAAVVDGAPSPRIHIFFGLLMKLFFAKVRRTFDPFF